MTLNDSTVNQDETLYDNDHEIANMDALDFMTLLMESRIIQPS